MTKRRQIYLLLLSFFFPISLLACTAPFIYHPTKPILQTPARQDIEYETIRFDTCDGVKLAGWWVPSPSSPVVILYCHGNAGNISHRVYNISIFRGLGYSVFIFDYRGFGESQGRPSEKGTYLDALAAWEYLTGTRNIRPDDIVIFGRSLGGSIAAWLAHVREPKLLILDSTFTSLREAADDRVLFLLSLIVPKDQYKTISYLREVNCPVLIIHSRDDDVIPFEHGVSLYEAAKHPEKEFLETSGTHNRAVLESLKTYQGGIYNFISSHVEEKLH